MAERITNHIRSDVVGATATSMRQRTWVVMAVAAAVLATPGTASAGTAMIGGGGPVYEASPGEENALIVSYVDGAYRFEDPVGVIAGQGCSPVIPNVAECATSRPQVVVKLGDRNDSLRAFDRACKCVGGAGDDSLQGSAASDLLDGQEGNDTLRGGPGNDSLAGGKANDDLHGDDGNDRVEAGQGVDDVLDGGPGNDYLTTGQLMMGGAGNDRLLEDDPTNDTLLGESGDDLLIGGWTGDVAQGGDGNDRLVGAQDAAGGPGDDVLAPDQFITPSVQQRLDGGAGLDTVEFQRFPGQTILVSLDGRANDGDPTIPEQDNVLPSIENMRGGPEIDRFAGSAGANQLFGGDANDRLDGRGGDDWLSGEAGNDTLSGVGGADLLDGGDDVDTADYRQHTAAVVASLDGVANDGAEDVDCAAGACPGPPADNALVENLRGGAGDDQLTGDDGPNLLAGYRGADALLGLDGDDDLDARDNEADLEVDCDGGDDIARLEISLDPVPANCETINPRH